MANAAGAHHPRGAVGRSVTETSKVTSAVATQAGTVGFTASSAGSTRPSFIRINRLAHRGDVVVVGHQEDRLARCVGVGTAR